MKHRFVPVLAGLMAALFLGGCGTHEPLPRLEYRLATVAGTAAQMGSSVSTSASLETGAAVGHALTSYALMPGGYAMPIQSGPSPVGEFNAEDQAAFLQNLTRILAERNVIRLVLAEDHPAASLKVKFLKTEHFPDMQDYVLDVLVAVRSGNRIYEKVYHVSTIDGVNVVSRMFQHGIDGRRRAAELLIQAVVPDLEHWFADSAVPLSRAGEQLRLDRPFAMCSGEVTAFLREHYARPSTFWKDGISVIARWPSASVAVIELRWSDSDLLPPFCVVDLYADGTGTRIEIQERNPVLSARVGVTETIREYVRKNGSK